MANDKHKEPIAKFRKDKKMSIEALAQCVGVTRRTIIRWESGEPRIPAHRLDAAATALGVKRLALRPDLHDATALGTAE